MRYGESGPHEMNELVMDSTHTTFLISRRTTFRKGVPRLMGLLIQIKKYGKVAFHKSVTINEGTVQTLRNAS